jgi:sec-independent protein translocase protein TatB
MMFDIGWSEMLVIAVVLIVVVGPKDLPRMLRTFGKTTAKLRAMAGDFQKQFNDALKEAELEDLKKSVDELRGLNPASEIRKQLNPFEQAAQEVRTGLNSALKPPPSSSAAPAAAEARAAEPLKNGATEMPGVGGPSAMPSEAPVFQPVAEKSMPPNTDAANIAAVIPPAAKRSPKPKAAGGVNAKTAAKPKAAARPKTASSKTKTAGSAS